jgi:hypothetical protein
LLIGNVANANFTGNGNVVLSGNGVWRPAAAVAGNTTEIQYNLNGVLTATNNMRYDTANNVVTFEGVTNLLDKVIVEGDIIPFQSNTYNLGNSTHRWKDIYLSNNSVVLGATTLSSDGGLRIDGEIAVTAVNDTITIGNLDANTLFGEGGNITGLKFDNIVDIGNVATINLSGNSSQVLDGNGQWAAKQVQAPYIEWSVLSNGNNQSFTNANLSYYTTNSQLSLFRNGVLVAPAEYTLLGNTITINTYMLAGDNLDVIAKTVDGISYNAIQAPLSASSPGIAGQIAYGNGFIYVCVATNTWQRAPLATW